MALKTLLFVFLLTLTSLFADTSSTDAEFHGEAKAKITFLEKQNDELKTKLDSLEDKQKSVDDYKAIIDRQDKRVEDVNSKMSVAGVIVAFLAIIIGIGGVALPYMIYKQNKQAQEEAKRDIKIWKETTKKEFDEELAKFKEHANAKTEEITKKAEKVHWLLEKVEKSQDISKLDNDISSEEQELASSESQKLATKAKKTSSWKDYITSAKLSYFAKNYGDTLRNSNEAIHELSKIVKDENAEEFIKEQLSQMFFIKGLTLGEMNKSAEAIQTYDELLQTFKDTSNDVIKEQMAKALYSKGFRLVKINKSEEAIKVYDEMLQIFKDTSNRVIKGQMISAQLNIFEYLLINNQEWSNEKIKLFKQHVNDNKQSLLKFKMLEIVKNAVQQEQTYSIERLKDEFSDTAFGSWSWQELEAWVATLQDEQKERVEKTLYVFKNWDKK